MAAHFEFLTSPSTLLTLGCCTATLFSEALQQRSREKGWARVAFADVTSHAAAFREYPCAYPMSPAVQPERIASPSPDARPYAGAASLRCSSGT